MSAASGNISNFTTPALPATAVPAPHSKPVPQPSKANQPKIDLTPIIHQAPAEMTSIDPKVEQVIDNRLKTFRNPAWEDDISRNTMDDQPFENLPSMRSRGEYTYRNINQMPDELLAGRNLANLARRDPYPIPSANDREGYAPGQDERYWLSGLADHFKMMKTAKEHGTFVRSYFDFGCATGRVIRHFACQTDIPEIWGSDINARHTRWLSEFMPRQVKPIANHCIPSLPIADNSIDLISAFSVFTHIDTYEVCWLAELARCLSPKGIAYLTVHNENTWLRLRKELDNPENRLLQAMRKMDPETDQKLMKPLADTRTVYRHTAFGPYRAQVFHSNNYLHRVWGRFFDILEIKPSYHARQTVLVLKKR